MNRKRMVLLARAGAARERAEEAVTQAGLELAAALDPLVSGEDDVRKLAPDAVLVLLDPAMEQVLDKFDGVLGDPALEILFEDADAAAKREGWEVARWARHLNAKLHGHQDVLPRAPTERDATAQAPSDTPTTAADLQALALQVEAMGEPPAAIAAAVDQPSGAVVIVSGVGGPDAVRQLLGGLPVGFARPVLLRQQIEGGQYDKLVRQMARATSLPVVLAQAGDPLRPGQVHVMPEGLDVKAAPAGLVFAPSTEPANFAALRPGDSALLLLSGADVALVDVGMAWKWAGGLVLGQSTENCFDPAASNALVARGGDALSIAQLPRKLLERWPA